MRIYGPQRVHSVLTGIIHLEASNAEQITARAIGSPAVLLHLGKWLAQYDHASVQQVASPFTVVWHSMQLETQMHDFLGQGCVESHGCLQAALAAFINSNAEMLSRYKQVAR